MPDDDAGSSEASLTLPNGTAAAAGHAGCLCHRPEIQSLTRRISADLSRRGFVAGMAASIASLGLPKPANAQSARCRPAVAADPVHEFPAVRRKIRHVARRAPSARRGQSDQGRGGGQPGRAGRRAGDRLRWPGSYAGPDRRALAFDLCRAAAPDFDDRGYRLHLSGRQRGGRAHADARLHHGPGSRRPRLRVEAGDRRRSRVGPAHLSVRRHDHRHRRSWRLTSVVRSAECRRHAQPRGADPAAASSPTARMQVRLRVREQLHAGCVADQARGKRRRIVTAQPAATRPLSPSPNCARGSKRPKTGPPTSRCTLIRRPRSSGRSPPGSGASNTVI